MEKSILERNYSRNDHRATSSTNDEDDDTNAIEKQPANQYREYMDANNSAITRRVLVTTVTECATVLLANNRSHTASTAKFSRALIGRGVQRYVNGHSKAIEYFRFMEQKPRSQYSNVRCPFDQGVKKSTTRSM